MLKHAGLVQLCLELNQLVADNNTIYVETHAFLLATKIPDTAAWREAANGFANENSGYAAYLLAEADAIAKGTYRCSAGLALDTIKPFAAFLAEVDERTRRELEAQLKEEGRSETTTVVGDASQLPLRYAANQQPVVFLCWSILSTDLRKSGLLF